MRRNPTPAGKSLWKVLHKKNLEGYGFRRQHIIGKGMVDFYCPAKKLIIKLSGEQQFGREELSASYLWFLESRGYRILFFGADEVLNNLDNVIKRIIKELHR